MTGRPFAVLVRERAPATYLDGLASPLTATTPATAATTAAPMITALPPAPRPKRLKPPVVDAAVTEPTAVAVTETVTVDPAATEIAGETPITAPLVPSTSTT